MVRGRELQRMSRAERDQVYRELQLTAGLRNLFTFNYVPGELEQLPALLSPNEDLLVYTNGYMDGNSWLLALTDRRILMLDNRLLTGMEQHSIELDRINAISSNRGILNGSIAIQDGAAAREISNMPNGAVHPFVNRVQAAIEARKYPTPAAHHARRAAPTAPEPPRERTSGAELRRMLDDDRESLFERMSAGMLGVGAKPEAPWARLPDLLADDERLWSFTNGTNELQDCLLALTDQRLLAFTASKDGELVEQTIPLNAITNLTKKRGPFMSRLTIEYGADSLRITGMPKNGLARLIEDIHAARASAPEPDRDEDESAEAADGDAWIEQLERLAELHRAGALDDAEFQAAKRRLLS